MAKKKNPDPEVIETQELYDTGIEPLDAGEYTKEQVIIFGTNVSVARSCPMLWDGLVPVVRRILWFMYHDKKLLPDKRSQKALEFLPATAKYHPHGDQSILTAFENITKSWENSVMYIEMDGNEGSVAGDDAAAPRYLDAKLSQYSYKCFFEEFDESIIEMQPNYLRSDMIPVVFPAKYPNFLLNLTTGIAWGNSFVKVPFNLIEAFTLTQDLLEHPEMTEVYLFPDSPRGYDIIDEGVIRDICELGSGTVKIRARLSYHPEGNYILCNGFPERTTMDKLIKAIGEREHTSPLGIKDISDKSDLENTEFWIMLKKGVDPDTVIHELYSDKKIGLTSFASIQLNYADRTRMLSDTGTISLRDAILRWIDWRIDIKHRTIAKKLRKLREEKHRLEALIQLRHQKNLDAVFNIIKTSETDEEIIDKLMNKFGFTSYQADLISNMKIKNQKKASIAEYVKQYEEIDSKIAETEELLVSKDKIKEVIWNELEEGKKLFGRPRSCRIIKPESTKPPIFHYRLVVTKKYIKRLARNGVGAGYVDSDDSPIAYFNDITSVDYIHIGTENGYWCYVPIDSIPTCDPSSKGTPLESLIGDKIGNAVVAVKTSLSRIKNNPEQYRLYCFTAKGLIKATPLDKFTVTRKMNTAIIVNEGDRVCFMGVFSNSDNERLLYTKSGYGLIFNLSVVPSTGRATKGQRFIKVGNDDEVLGVSVSKGIKDVLVLTKKGFGKITELDDIFIATKKRQKMIPLTRFNDGDELFDIIPIRDEDVFYESKLEIQMQSGDITEIDTKKIKRASRNSKCFKIAPVRRGDCIIRVKLI